MEVEQSLAAKFSALLPHLDERTQRLYLGSEARSLGYGGITAVARAAGVSRQTVAGGVDELEGGAPPSPRVRRRGGGRKRATEVYPGLRAALLALVQPDERGDPMSPLRWTTQSTRTLAEQLTRQGYRVSADTVGDVLREEGFSLQGNAKIIEGAQHPDRDAQFRYINDQAQRYQAAGDPVLSVDTKKKELVGQYKNTGRQWRPAGEPVTVHTHDFPDKDLGKAIPYGIYDLAANTGWVAVGTDHNTAAFAVACLRRWWATAGHTSYRSARRLLITADAGGSNGYRTRAWKAELAALAVDTGLEITVCHFPPGTSKWNTIEHRLFSHITMNWRGRPLSSHEVIVNSIAATTTRTGLSVHAELDTDTYPLGVQISDRQMNVLPLRRHDWHGEWNYTLRPDAYLHTLTTRDLFDQPSPALAWLAHPAITGLSTSEWAVLIAALSGPHQHRREDHLHRRRGYQARHPTASTARHPGLTLADRLLATVLHHRHGLPQVAIATLFQVRPETINRHIRGVRDLLDETGHTLPVTGPPLATLADLEHLAATAGITLPPPTT
jgi:transposase